MKPIIPNFVLRGVAALQTEAMKAMIRECFLTDGRVGVAKLPETYQRALAALPEAVEELPVPEKVENEEDLGPICEKR